MYSSFPKDVVLLISVIWLASFGAGLAYNVQCQRYGLVGPGFE